MKFYPHTIIHTIYYVQEETPEISSAGRNIYKWVVAGLLLGYLTTT